MLNKLKTWIIKRDLLVVWILICLYVVYFSLYTCSQHYNFKTNAFDLGIFAQSVWHAIHYGTLTNSLEIPQLPINHLAIHFSPILYLMVPFYFLFPDPKILLILQSAALGVAALPCYLIAKDKINNPFICLIIVISFLLYPFLHYVNLYDFHPVALAIPILLFCLYFLEKQKYGWFWLFFLLSLLIKENVILSGIGIGAYIFITKRKFLLGIIIIAISTLFFFATTNIFMPFLGQVFNYTHKRYADLIGSGHHSYTDLIIAITTKPTILFKYIFFNHDRLLAIFKLFFPVLFFPLFSGFGAIFLLLPGLLINLLSSYDRQYNFYSQYSSTVIPIIYFLTVLGISNVLKKFHYQKNLQKLIIACLLASLVVTSINARLNIISFFKTFIKCTPSTIISPHNKILTKAIKLIPPKASVSATGTVVPHLINRKKIFLFPTINNANYIVANLNKIINLNKKVTTIINALLQDKKYGPIFFKDNILILQKNYNTNKNQITIDKINMLLKMAGKKTYNNLYISIDDIPFSPKLLRKILRHKYIHIRWSHM